MYTLKGRSPSPFLWLVGRTAHGAGQPETDIHSPFSGLLIRLPMLVSLLNVLFVQAVIGMHPVVWLYIPWL